MMKLILRADDLGFSEAVNLGIYKAIHDGLVTSVGMMPNMEYARHGYELIKNEDVALGMHTNICVGTPLASPEKIPSLVGENGEFCSSKEIRLRKEDTIDIKECEIEIEAQLERFIEITGQKPDYFEGHAVFSANFFTALKNVAKRHNLFYCVPGLDNQWEEEYGIYGLGFAKMTPDNLYDPKAYLEENLENIKNHPCSVMVLHPGFLDQYILTHSSYTLIRPMECDFACGEWLKKFIADNNIQLVSFKNYQL